MLREEEGNKYWRWAKKIQHISEEENQDIGTEQIIKTVIQENFLEIKKY